MVGPLDRTMTRWCLVLAFVTGCSFSLEGPDPKRAAHTAPTCETGKGRVLTDGLIATTLGVTTLSVAASSGAAAIIPAVIGAVFVGAAVHGNNLVEDCRKANTEYLALREDGAPPQPRPVTGPPEEVEPVAQQPVAPPAPLSAPAPAAPAPAAPAPAPAPVPEPATWAAFWKDVR